MIKSYLLNRRICEYWTVFEHMKIHRTQLMSAVFWMVLLYPKDHHRIWSLRGRIKMSTLNWFRCYFFQYYIDLIWIFVYDMAHWMMPMYSSFDCPSLDQYAKNHILLTISLPVTVFSLIFIYMKLFNHLTCSLSMHTSCRLALLSASNRRRAWNSFVSKSLRSCIQSANFRCNWSNSCCNRLASATVSCQFDRISCTIWRNWRNSKFKKNIINWIKFNEWKKSVHLRLILSFHSNSFHSYTNNPKGNWHEDSYLFEMK